LAFALRVVLLDRQSLWYDETFSLAVARADWPIFWLALLSDGVHPPGYYLLMRVCLDLLGPSEFALRFPSVVAGTLTVPLIWQLGLALGSRRWAGAAAMLLAVNPFALWHAQEARMYSLLLCLVIAGGYAFWKLIIRPCWSRWLWFTLVSALIFAVHYFAFVFSLAQFVYLIINLRRTHRALRWWALAQVAAFLPFLPWAMAIATRDGRNFGIGWIRPPTLLDVPLTLTNLSLALSNPGWAWTWAAFVLILTLATVGAVLARTTLFPTSCSSPPSRWLFLASWLVIPLAFIWVISLRLPLYVDRFFIICLPPLMLLTSTISLSPTRLARGTMVGLVLISAAASFRLLIDPRLAKEDWRATAAYVQAGEKAGDTLVMRDFQTGIPFGTYYRGVLDPQPATINQQTTPLDELSAGYDRMWLVYRRPFESTHRLAGSDPFTWHHEQEPTVHDWLVRHDPGLVKEETFPGTYVVLYHLSLAGCATDDQD
jgi:uncharacterized membrane protein